MEGSKTPGSISDDIEHHSMTEGSEDKTGNHAASQLPTEHHDYLLNRHGTAELDPVPSASDADPYNWPMWKVSEDLHTGYPALRFLHRRPDFAARKPST